jgi:chromosome segregation ATPase
MTTRSEYVEQLKKNLDQWNADIAKWEAKARMAQTDLRIDYEMQLEALRKQREEITAKLKEIQASGEEAWKDLRAGSDAAWAAMREAFENATSHFQK